MTPDLPTTAPLDDMVEKLKADLRMLIATGGGELGRAVVSDSRGAEGEKFTVTLMLEWQG